MVPKKQFCRILVAIILVGSHNTWAESVDESHGLSIESTTDAGENLDYEEEGIDDLTNYLVLTESTPLQNQIPTTIDETTTENYVIERQSFIKPAITTELPRSGVSSLIVEEEITTIPPSVREIKPDHGHTTENPEEATIILEQPDYDDDSEEITKFLSKMKEIVTNELSRTTPKHFNRLLEEKRLSTIVGTIDKIECEVDQIIQAHPTISIKLANDIRKQYRSLRHSFGLFNQTINDFFRQNTDKHVAIVLSFLKRDQIVTAAYEVNLMYDDTQIQLIVDQFYQGNQRKISKLITFAYNLKTPTQQIISLHALLSEMNKHNHTRDPGVLPMYDKIVQIQNLLEFQNIKLDAGIVRFDAFRRNLETAVNDQLTNWQNDVHRGQYRNIVNFASTSSIYSSSLNKNMIRLLWTPTTFEVKLKFLNALPHVENRVTGYKYLLEVYKTHHHFQDMIKLAITVKDEFDKPHVNKSILNECKEKFWPSVKKLVWSDSCLIKHVLTNKYLFEYEDQKDNGLNSYIVETIKRVGGDERTYTNDFRWVLLPLTQNGEFEIQNKEYLHSLIVEDALDDFKYWPRRVVKVGHFNPSGNYTQIWRVVIASEDEKYSFTSEYGFLTAGRNKSAVYADNVPSITKIKVANDELTKKDIEEFQEHHRWELECFE